MSLKSALGLESAKKVRYGIVALGDISQESFMPGVAHTGNSIITALVTGDPVKADQVAKQYDVPPPNVYGYNQFDTLIHSGKIDAIYLATPNWRHAEFAVPALKAGIHVLLEKPMEVSVEKCQQILDSQKTSAAKLMVAYRLHFEPATLAVIELLRSGKIGTVRGFTSVFAQNVDPANHRAQHGVAAGPLLDMGAYPLNAVRNLFEAEPIEVFAYSVRHPDAGLGDLDDTVTVLLKFSDNRIAQFTASYAANMIDTFTVFGSAGSVRLDPAYGFGNPKTYTLTVDKTESTQSFKATDHFGGELKYFSDCILNNIDPEPNGQEGYCDVRVFEAILESASTGKPVGLQPVQRDRRIDINQVQKLSMVSPPKVIDAKQPGK